MKSNSLSVLSVVPALVLVLAGSFFVPSASAAEEKPKVVALTAVLADLATQVAGGHAEVFSIIPPGGDPHVYQPTPADVKRVAQADLVLASGYGLEGFLTKLKETSSEARWVTIGEKLPLAESGVQGTGSGCSTCQASHSANKPEHDHAGHDHDDHAKEAAKHDHAGHDHDDHAKEAAKHDHAGHDHHDHAKEATKHDHAGHDHHDHGPIDPHWWHSLRLTGLATMEVATALAEIQPEHKAQFQKNAKAYQEKLSKLATWARAEVAAIPRAQRVLVTSHDAFAYLGEELGLEVHAVSGLSTLEEPSSKHVANLIKLLKDRKVTAVFIENTSNPKTVEVLAREAGVRIGGKLIPAGPTGEEGAADFIEAYRHNVKTITAALR